MSKINYAMLKYDEDAGKGLVAIKQQFFDYEDKITRLDVLSDWIRQLQYVYDNECNGGVYND